MFKKSEQFDDYSESARKPSMRGAASRAKEVFTDVLDRILALFLRSVRVVLHVPGWLLGILLFAAGIGVGVIIMKQRRAAGEVIVTVRGEKITAPEFFHRMEAESGNAVLQKMVNERLTLQFARQRHVLPTNAQVEARMQQGAVRGNIDDYLKQTHQTREDVAARIRATLAGENLFGTDVPVTEDEARAFYRSQTDPRNPRARYYVPQMASIQVIAVRSRQEAANARAEMVSGATFEAVAKKYSKDRSAATGGAGPKVVRGKSALRMFPGFEEAVFALEPGTMLGPRQFGKTWWIVRCNERSLAVTVPYDIVRQECLDAAKLQKGVAMRSAEVRGDFERFRKQSPIQLFWDQYHYTVFGEDRAGQERRVSAGGDSNTR